MPNPATVLNVWRFLPLDALPLAAYAIGGSVGVSLPTFCVKAADWARVAYMPGTAWPVTGYPPDSSWNLVHAPVLMPSQTNFDTSAAIRLRSSSRSPPGTLTAHLFPNAHHNSLQLMQLGVNIQPWIDGWPDLVL